jgi:elongation factor P
MVFTVVDTAPGVKGNSATNVFKDATLENGLTIKVPPFIKNGEKVRVDTRTSTYTEKAS